MWCSSSSEDWDPSTIEIYPLLDFFNLVVKRFYSFFISINDRLIFIDDSFVHEILVQYFFILFSFVHTCLVFTLIIFFPHLLILSKILCFPRILSFPRILGFRWILGFTRLLCYIECFSLSWTRLSITKAAISQRVCVINYIIIYDW